LPMSPPWVFNTLDDCAADCARNPDDAEEPRISLSSRCSVESEIMGQGTRFPWVYLLLLASTIHGIAPDAANLVSLRSLYVICPVLGDPNDFADEDGEYSEVCGAIQGAKKSSPRAPVDSIPFLGLTRSELSGRTIGSNAIPLARSRDAAVPIDDPIPSLCRLNC
jgi:hypothetical protein